MSTLTISTIPTKFCINCEYATGSFDTPETLRCSHPGNSVEHSNLAKFAVTGIAQPTVKAMLATNCIVMRTYDKHPSLGVDMCGPDGKWWEPKT